MVTEWVFGQLSYSETIPRMSICCIAIQWSERSHAKWVRVWDRLTGRAWEVEVYRMGGKGSWVSMKEWRKRGKQLP